MKNTLLIFIVILLFSCVDKKPKDPPLEKPMASVKTYIPDNFIVRTVQTLTIELEYVSNAIQADRPTIVLLHGWPQSWYAYRKMMPLLHEDFNVIALNLPGTGNSEPSLQGYDTKAIAVYLNAFLEALNIASAHIVGHDVGAWVAYSFAKNHPEKTKTLTVMEGGIPGLAPIQKLAFTEKGNPRTWQFAFNQIDGLPEQLVTGREALYLKWFFDHKMVVRDAINDEDFEEYVSTFSKPETLKSGFDYYRAFNVSAEQNLNGKNSKLGMPVLAIGADGSLGKVMTTLMEPLCVNLRGTVIENSGHYNLEEQPETTTAELLTFIKKSDSTDF
ncbi:alpha/beta fold hydrolase [Maribacter sp. 2307ULW6-5]|uniref:alpha/beta fold hydrolase n=1 Tax=Maribacter sp. 2307ULW6-5 TaxID=3386275 RepID=UPI0039BC4227